MGYHPQEDNAMMIACLVLPLTLALSGQGQFGRPEWIGIYPINNREHHFKEMGTPDVVAIVEAVSREQGLRLDAEPGEGRFELPTPFVYCVKDTFRVLDCAYGAASGEITVYVRQPSRYWQPPPSPVPPLTPGKRYLLAASNPDGERLALHVGDWAMPNAFVPLIRVTMPAYSGLFLLPTRKPRVASGESKQERVLLSIAEAFEGASQEDGRALSYFMQTFTANKLPGEPSEPPTQIGGIAWDAWMRRNWSPVVERAIPTVQGYIRSAIYSLILKYYYAGRERYVKDRWSESFLQSLEEADAQGYQYSGEFPLTSSTLFVVPPNRMMQFVRNVNSPRLKIFGIDGLPKPDADGIHYLISLLGHESVHVRYMVLYRFSQWGNRPDLEPKWEGPTERRIVNEEELIRYWRENPPR